MSAAQTDPAALVQRGQLMRSRGDASGANLAFGEALARDHSFWPALLERGMLRLDGGEISGALRDLRACVRLAPAQPQALLYLGNAENAAGRPDAALHCFQLALEHAPGFAQAHYNCGVIQFHAGRLAEAAESYRAAIAQQPGFVLAHSNLGVVLEAMDDTEAALAAYDAAIRADPNDPSPRWNRALALLRDGQYAEGWRLYEWRWAAGKAGPMRQFPGRPLWLGGRRLAGRTILLHAEPGLADAIQFVRYAPLLAAQGARVILELPQPLVALCEQLPGVAQVIGTGGTLPEFEFHCPLMSLPLVFGTRVETIPNEMPYLAAPAERCAAWAARLEPDRLRLTGFSAATEGVKQPVLINLLRVEVGAHSSTSTYRAQGKRPRIAFAWKGNPQHEGDGARSLARSLALELFAELFAAAAEFICLQPDLTPAEAAILAGYPQVRQFGEAFADFAGTAAILASCDLLISVDTALAQLAGALAKPTWLLLPQRADWRWGKQSESSPWYPTMRLFRGDDWPGLMADVAAAMAQIFRG